jgi:hypothetical protein
VGLIEEQGLEENAELGDCEEGKPATRDQKFNTKASIADIATKMKND